MTLKLEHCQPFATAVASSGENIRSSGEPDKIESGGFNGGDAAQCAGGTVCCMVPVLPARLRGG